MEWFWLFSYIISFFGSVSFGYLILRFGLPDIRGVPKQLKLGLAGVVGIILFTISLAISLFFFTPMHLYVFLPALTLLGSVFFEVRNRVLAPKTVKVAVPIVRMQPRPMPSAPVPVPTVKRREKPKPEMPERRRPKRLERKIPERIERKILERPEIIERKEIKKPVEEIKPLEEFKKPVVREFRVEGEKPKKALPSAEITPEMVRKDEEMARAMMTHTKAREGRGELREERRRRREEKRMPEEIRETRGRRRYLEHRGELVEQAKSDMMRRYTGPEEPLPSLPEGLGEGLDLEDLENISSLDELSYIGLEDLADMDVSLETLAGMSKTETLEKEKGMKCPNCGKAKGTIVYCPYCGKGLCSDCSEKVERKQDMIFYLCPHCKKEVVVKG